MNCEDSVNLDDLVRKARSGCSASKEQLFAMISPELNAIAQVRVGRRFVPKATASDAVQDVLIRAFRKFNEFRGYTGAEFRGWCFVILGHWIIDTGRSLGAARRDEDREQSLGSSGDGQLATRGSDSPPNRILRSERDELVLTALSRLSSDHETVIRLREFEGGRTWAEVASTMGRSEDAVQKLYLRALEKLEHDDQLKSEFGDDA